MKVKYFKKTVFALVVIFIIVTFTGCGFSYSFGNANELKKEDALRYEVKKTVVDPIKKIDISTNMADIDIVEDDNYYVEIKY